MYFKIFREKCTTFHQSLTLNMFVYAWFDLYYRNAPAPADSTDSTPKPRGRPLYDVPYMFEAREFLRKKLIGKKVRYG